MGALLGAAELASRMGRSRSYLSISIGAIFFGWLALYLPEIFPVQVRATGSGLAYNFGRFGTAIGVMGTGFLFGALGGDYLRVGAICALP